MDYNTDFEMDFEDRIMEPSEIPSDAIDSDNPLRPKTLEDYIGQDKDFYRSG